MDGGSWRPVAVTVVEVYPAIDGARAVLRYVVDGVEHLVSRRVGDRGWRAGQALRGSCWSGDPSALSHELAP